MMNDTNEQGNDLSLDDIYAFNDIKIERVYVPKWQGYVYLKEQSGHDLDKLEKQARNGIANIDNIRAQFIAMSLCDKDGNRIVKAEDANNHYRKLSLKSGAALNFLVDKISEMNKVSQEDLEKMAKNS